MATAGRICRRSQFPRRNPGDRRQSAALPHRTLVRVLPSAAPESTTLRDGTRTELQPPCESRMTNYRASARGTTRARESHRPALESDVHSDPPAAEGKAETPQKRLAQGAQSSIAQVSAASTPGVLPRSRPHAPVANAATTPGRWQRTHTATS